MSPRDDGLVRERDGDLVPAVPAHHCDGGWIARGEDRVVPCPVCRPHLQRRADGTGYTTRRDRAAGGALTGPPPTYHPTDVEDLERRWRQHQRQGEQLLAELRAALAGGAA